MAQVWWRKFAVVVIGFNFSSILHGSFFFSIPIPFKLKLQFQANMSKPSMFFERSCKNAKMFAMVFCTEPESEDFAYWDDDGMKVLHCDHTFELRSQESSLLLHQEGKAI